MYLQVGRQWNVILFVPFVHFLIVLFYRLINRFDILLPEFSDFAERMLTPVKEIAVVQLCGGTQKMENMNRLLPIPLMVIDPKCRHFGILWHFGIFAKKSNKKSNPIFPILSDFV